MWKIKNDLVQRQKPCLIYSITRIRLFPTWRIFYYNCYAQPQCSFGNIIDDEMMLNEFGVLVQNEWLKTGIIRPNINIDAFVIMPNHLHGIIIITDNDNGHSRNPRDSRDSRRDTLQRVSTITDTDTDTNTDTITDTDTDTNTDTIADTNTNTNTDTITDTEMGTETDMGTIEQFGKPTKNSIPTIVRSFKSTTTKQINQMRQTPTFPCNRILLEKLIPCHFNRRRLK